MSATTASGGHVIVRSLAAHGVPRVFCVPGESYLDVLDAQRSLFTAQQQVVQVKAAEAQNRVTLYRVLGGGWTDADLLSVPPGVTEVSGPGRRASSHAAGGRKTASAAPVL